MISLYGFRAVESILLLSPTCGSPLACLPGSTLAFLMLMEVSTPGRKLKPPSSMKAGSSCPWTMTLAPVTVDSSGMKSFCSVRSVRDRPASTEGAKLGRSWRCVRGWKPPLPPAWSLLLLRRAFLWVRKTYIGIWQPLDWTGEGWGRQNWDGDS